MTESRRDQKPRELHMAQWSQGLPLGSTEHCFSFSKNSTSSETVASSTPNLSWLGWEAICGSCMKAWSFAREKGASQGDSAACGIDLGERSWPGGGDSFWGRIDDRVGGGGDDETKLITRARDPPCLWTPLPDAGSFCSRVGASPARRRATRSAINRAGS